jgi:hypothetical protein
MIRPTSRHTALAAIMFTAVLGLAGCGKHDAPSSNSGDDAQPAASAESAAEQAADAKFNGYVNSYNQLTDRYGINYKAGGYLRQDVVHARDGTPLFFTFELDGELKALRDARAIPSEAYPDLDKIADAMVKDFQVLHDLSEAHSNYYRTQAFRDDKYALAKQLDPQIRDAYSDALQQFEQLGTALEQAEEARSEKDLATLKQLPNPLPYDTKHVIVLGKQLVNTITSAQSLKDQAAMIKADAAKTELYQATDALDKEIKKQKSEHDSLSTHGMVLFQAQSLLSDYADLRRSGDERHIETMVRSYNEMVKYSNQI